MKVAICETRLKPRLITKESSIGDGTVYTTVPSTIWNDPICDCKGFQFRGKCRHIEEVEANACHWIAKWQDTPSDGKCPWCHGPIVLFKLNPEFE